MTDSPLKCTQFVPNPFGLDSCKTCRGRKDQHHLLLREDIACVEFLPHTFKPTICQNCRHSKEKHIPTSSSPSHSSSRCGASPSAMSTPPPPQPQSVPPTNTNSKPSVVHNVPLPSSSTSSLDSNLSHTWPGRNKPKHQDSSSVTTLDTSSRTTSEVVAKDVISIVCEEFEPHPFAPAKCVHCKRALAAHTFSFSSPSSNLGRPSSASLTTTPKGYPTTASPSPQKLVTPPCFQKSLVHISPHGKESPNSTLKPLPNMDFFRDDSPRNSPVDCAPPQQLRNDTTVPISRSVLDRVAAIGGSSMPILGQCPRTATREGLHKDKEPVENSWVPCMLHLAKTPTSTECDTILERQYKCHAEKENPTEGENDPKPRLIVKPLGPRRSTPSSVPQVRPVVDSYPKANTARICGVNSLNEEADQVDIHPLMSSSPPVIREHSVAGTKILATTTIRNAHHFSDSEVESEPIARVSGIRAEKGLTSDSAPTKKLTDFFASDSD